MRPGLTTSRIVALFILALLLFNPPIITLFDRGADVRAFGMPLFYGYLFAIWAVIIGLAAIMTRHSDEPPMDSELPVGKDSANSGPTNREQG